MRRPDDHDAERGERSRWRRGTPPSRASQASEPAPPRSCPATARVSSRRLSETSAVPATAPKIASAEPEREARPRSLGALLGRGLGPRRPGDQHPPHPAPGDLLHHDLDAIHLGPLAAPRHPAERVQHQAADSGHVLPAGSCGPAALPAPRAARRPPPRAGPRHPPRPAAPRRCRARPGSRRRPPRGCPPG